MDILPRPAAACQEDDVRVRITEGDPYPTFLHTYGPTPDTWALLNELSSDAFKVAAFIANRTSAMCGVGGIILATTFRDIVTHTAIDEDGVLDALRELYDHELIESWKEDGLPAVIVMSAALYISETIEAHLPRVRPPTPTYQKHRALIYARWGQFCLRCGSTEEIELDHVVPRSRSGSDEPDNLQPLCKPCNNRKKAKTVDYRVRHVSSTDDDAER